MLEFETIDSDCIGVNYKGTCINILLRMNDYYWYAEGKSLTIDPVRYERSLAETKKEIADEFETWFESDDEYFTWFGLSKKDI